MRGLPKLSASDISNQVVAGVLLLAVGGAVTWLASSMSQSGATGGSTGGGADAATTSGSPAAQPSSSSATAAAAAPASPHPGLLTPVSAPTPSTDLADPGDEPAAVAAALLDAWLRGDREAAARVAIPTAVDALFAAEPLAVATFDACYEAGEQVWDCGYFDPGRDLVMRVARGVAGLRVVEIAFFES